MLIVTMFVLSYQIKRSQLQVKFFINIIVCKTNNVRAILLHNNDDNTDCRKPLQLRSHQHRERVQINEKFIPKVNFT